MTRSQAEEFFNLVFDLRKLGKRQKQKTLLAIFLSVGVQKGQETVTWEQINYFFISNAYQKFIGKKTTGATDSVKDEDLKKL